MKNLFTKHLIQKIKQNKKTNAKTFAFAIKNIYKIQRKISLI